MKKSVLILVSLLLIFSLSACSDEPVLYTVDTGDGIFELNTVTKTISDETYTYQYELSGNFETYTIHIFYPDGSTYYQSKDGGAGWGGWSDDYKEGRYASGSTLCSIIANNTLKPSRSLNPMKWLSILFAIGFGVFSAVRPEKVWYMGVGWKFKDAEPSDGALTLNCVLGILLIILGIILIFV